MLRKILTTLFFLFSTSAIAGTGNINDQNILTEALTTASKKQKSAIEYSLQSMKKLNTAHDRYIIVNIPAFYLYAVQQGNVVLDSKVIVGSGSRDANTTPEITTHVSGIMYNPYWSPPPGLLEERILPNWEKDSFYLKKTGYHVMRVYDQQYVDESQVTPAMILSKEYVIMQKPGPNNVLGKILFILNDSQDVYLHDTNHPELFNKDYRNFSFGCIRVQQWKKLAAWISLTSTEYIDRTIASGFTSTDGISVHTPVYIVYWPADVVNGKVVYYNDIYGLLK